MKVLAEGAGSYAGPLGLLVVLLLAVATVLLIRNMNKRITRLPESFDSPAKGGTADTADTDDIDPDDLAG